MKTNWQHQKDAITTDQKNRTDDEHIHEQEKARLQVRGKEGGSIPKSGVDENKSEGSQR
jgi:hypothetical protein